MTVAQSSLRLCVETIPARDRRVSPFVFAAVLLLQLSARTWGAQPPALTVDPASQVSSTAALVTGTVNPDSMPAAFRLQWGLTTAYGSTTYFRPIAAVSTPTNVAAWMTNLAPSTTYHYQLVATNSAGTGYSADMTVTTASGPGPDSVPTVTAYAATDVTDVSATITGTVNPNGLQSAAWIMWGTTTLYSHHTDVAYSLTGSTVVPVGTNLYGLTANTTYHYQLVATNGAGLASSPDLTFTTGQGTSPAAPTIVVAGATNITGISATITGSLNPNGANTIYHLEWGTTPVYDRSSLYLFAPAQNTPRAVAINMTGLSTNTTYHYQLVATNSAGESRSPDMTLTTTAEIPPVPVLTINPATNITSTTAKIMGTVNPNGLATAFRVEWGPTNDGYGNVGFYSSVLPETSPVAVSNIISALSPNSTYHCRLSATNSAGVGYSAEMTFTTGTGPDPTGAPIVTANSATDVTASTATISGTVNPNGLPTAAFVRWGTSTAYDHLLGAAFSGADYTTQPVSTSISGLNPNTTYHYQLVATNAAGNGYSADLTFTTPDGPPLRPSVTTGPAINISGGSARLTGTLNPNGAGTAYYFNWGLSTLYDNASTPVPVLAGSTSFSVFADIQGLTPNSTYHFQLVATNAAGIALGNDMAFRTDGATPEGDFLYTTFNGAATITGYIGPGDYVAIPATMGGLPVIAIGDQAFWYRTNLTGVAIPITVTNIGVAAFQGCSRISTVLLGTNLVAIGNNAFSYCPSLLNILLPGSLVSIGDSAFYSCGLTNLTIPDSVTRIGDAAFASCGALASLTFGHGLTQIRGGGENSMYGTFMFCSSLTRITIPDSITNISDGAIHLGGSLGAFYGCNSLTNVVVGKGLSYLGTGAFNSCPALLGAFFQGNAPTLGQNMFGEDNFHNSDSAIIYYLPGTTGWGSTYAGRPTVLWGAQVQNSAGTFGLQQNHFALTVSGTTNVPVVIEACTDLAAGDWAPVQTCTLTNGLLNFADFYVTNYPVRFYRVRVP